MSIKIETNQLTKMYIGDTKIIKAYLGDQQVYSSAPAGPVNSELMTAEAKRLDAIRELDYK